MKNTILALFLALFMGAGCDELGNFSLDDIRWNPNYYVNGIIVDSTHREGIPGVHFTHKWIDESDGTAHFETLAGTTDENGKFSVEIIGNIYATKSYLLLDTVLLREYRPEGYVNGSLVRYLFRDGIEIRGGQTNYYGIGLVKK